MSLIPDLAAHARVQAAMASFHENLDASLSLISAIQQVPAPTFEEAARAEFIGQQFVAVGLVDVYRDELNNVYGRLPGSQQKAPIILSAHLDTVFPAGTDLTLTESGGFLHGPGVADNSTALGALLIIAETLQTYDLQPAADIWFVANVGEEGLGDLFGMRAVVEHFGKDAHYIVLEGGLYGQVLHRAIAVTRYEIEVRAEGGHSWKNFGRPSAIHELGRLIQAISSLRVPRKPWTTFNVGVIEGGTSINTIAQHALLQLDLRSETREQLEQLRAKVVQIVARSNELRGVETTMTQIGSRPAGAIPRTAPLVELAEAALHQVGCDNILFTTGSTDANIPLSLGYSAVCIGLANANHVHRLDEYLDPRLLPNGLAQTLLLVLGAALLE